MSLSHGRHLAFPFRIGADGRAASPANDEEHLRDELVQLLLTDPGERAWLPDFGGGVRRLVFEPAGDELQALTRARITQAISRWLGHRAELEHLEVRVEGSRVEVDVRYRPAGSEAVRTLRFQRQGG